MYLSHQIFIEIITLMKNVVLHLIIVGTILFLFELFLPTTKFFVQLMGAFLVNLLFYDFTTGRRLIGFTAPFRLYWAKMVNNYLSAPSDPQGLENVKAFMHKRIIPSRGISGNFIESLTSGTAAGLVIGMQGEKEIKQDGMLTFVDFKRIAAKAAQSSEYRTFLLKKGTQHFPKIHEAVEKFDSQSEYTIGDDLKSISDEEFFRRLSRTKDEIVHVFTTTAQLSFDFIQGINAYEKNIAELNFYICSPNILSDNALLQLRQEYCNPQFTRKQGQFVTRHDGSVHIGADMVRRVIKILSAIKQVAENERHFKVNLNLFTEQYPGVKLKLLEREKYAQLQPGPLSYANNLYRFGVEIQRSEDFNLLKDDLHKFKLSPLVRSLSISKSDVDHMFDNAIRELSQWLWSEGISGKEILEFRDEIKKAVKDAYADEIIDEIVRKLDKAYSIIAKKDSLLEIPCSNEQSLHISVGLVIERNGALLLIKKADKYYQGKYSIVAGHVNMHETIEDAIHREAKEEIGVKIHKPVLIGNVIDVADKCRYGGERHVWFVFTAELKNLELQVDPSEIEHIQWVKVNEMAAFADELTSGAHEVLARLGYLK
jgi:ADP-ribose pyrophosphatase YjhB (NUDIX family)